MAHYLLDLAATSGADKLANIAGEDRDELALEMTEEDLAESRERSKQYREEHPRESECH